MVTELVSLIAVLGATVGAGLNAARAWWDAPDTEKFSWRKFVGGLVSGSVAAFALINFTAIGDTVSSSGYIGLFIIEALAGAGTSTLFSKLHA